MQTQKPRAVAGQMCPFWRRDVSKVCHTCELFDVLPIERISGGAPEQADLWGCTFKHQAFVQRDLLKHMAGLQQAEESFRNSAWKETQQNLHDIVESVKHQTSFNTDILRRFSDGMSDLARALGLAPRSRELSQTPTDPLLSSEEKRQ